MNVDMHIFADEIDDASLAQVERTAQSPAFEGAKIRIMPDVHAGAGSVIGFTAHVNNGRIIPNVVGLDIGCGMYIVPLGNTDIDFAELDRLINEEIPSGRHCHQYETVPMEYFERYHCVDNLKLYSYSTAGALGTLGGGNHFIEVDRDDDGSSWLIIHSGSRNLGKQVAQWYQKVAVKQTGSRSYGPGYGKIIEDLTAQGRQSEIQDALRNLKRPSREDDDIAYLYGDEARMYLEDMNECVAFARRNREAIADYILKHMGWDSDRQGEHVIHNYIELLGDGSVMIRKGAISAKPGETVLIPLNMQAGCILGKGTGNADWNMSAPHGAGRVCSRKQAKQDLSMEEFRKRMEGIYSTSVCAETLDEAPMAYKDPAGIMKNINETVTDVRILRPVYNFKAHEKSQYDEFDIMPQVRRLRQMKHD